MSTKFHNTNGTLTAYALNCGYIERHDVPGGRYSVALSAGGDYHVKVSDERLSLGLAAWESYATLTEARRAVRAAIRFYRDRNDVEPTERNTTYAPAPWEA